METLGQFIKYITAIIALVGAIKGIIEYSKSQKYKKIEMLERLITEFGNSDKKIAKDLLDDFWMKDKKDKIICYSNLEIVLRNHKESGVSDIVELDARESFDKLFDFFSKLDYLIQLKLISKRDLYYFEYYIEKTVANNGCMNYAEIYNYRSLESLRFILKG